MQGKSLVMQSMQTNEIAAAVQAGNADILDLWTAVKRYAAKRANRWNKAFQGRYGVTLDDLMQTAFIALAKAVELWDQERGGFAGAFELQLKSTFAELYRQRSKRNTLDPLNTAVSLDAPAEGTSKDGSTPSPLADILPDPAAQAAFCGTEQDELITAVRRAVVSLPEPERRAVIAYYWQGQRVDRTAKSRALRLLRRPEVSRKLQQFWR